MVFMAAAKVGGILANDRYPADFIRENLIIETNIIDACYQANVDRMLFLGSSCIYPKLCPATHQGRVSAHRPIGANQPSLTPSPKLPASRCAGPTTANTTPVTSLRCRPTCTGPATTSTRKNSHVLPRVDSQGGGSKSPGPQKSRCLGNRYPAPRAHVQRRSSRSLSLPDEPGRRDFLLIVRGRTADQHRAREST